MILLTQMEFKNKLQQNYRIKKVLEDLKERTLLPHGWALKMILVTKVLMKRSLQLKIFISLSEVVKQLDLVSDLQNHQKVLLNKNRENYRQLDKER